MKKKMKKSTWMTLALFIYITAMAIYFLPRNTEISNTEKYVTLAAAYVILFFLWIVLKKKEQAQERRREEEKLNNFKNKQE